jgi:hypothetical protein
VIPEWVAEVNYPTQIIVAFTFTGGWYVFVPPVKRAWKEFMWVVNVERLMDINKVRGQP